MRYRTTWDSTESEIVAANKVRENQALLPVQKKLRSIVGPR
jgi:hypothetical protein